MSYLPVSRFGADVDITISDINNSIVEYKMSNLPNPGDKLFDNITPGDLVLYTNTLLCIDHRFNLQRVKKLYVVEVNKAKKYVITEPMFPECNNVLFKLGEHGSFYEKRDYRKSDYFYSHLHLINDVFQEIENRKTQPKTINTCDSNRSNMMPGAYF